MNYYKILQAKQCGNAEGLTAYERQFVEYLKKIDIKTITGTLPLTFTAKAGNAVDWSISGNDDVGENLFDGNYQAAFINTSTNKYNILNEGRTAVIQCDPNTQYTISVWSGCNRLVVGEFETEPQADDTANILAAYTATIPQYITITTGANVNYIACYVSNQNNTPTISIVKGSTAPDHYIPYQQGVGERTANLFDKSNLVIGSYYTAQGQTGNSDAWSRTVNAIPVLPNTEYTFEPNSNAGASAKHLYLDADGTFISAIASGDVTFTTPSDCYYMQFSLRTSSTNVMLVKGSTAPVTYVPYGYEIPITVSQTGQPDKNYDIYIGDSPLTEGESVSKTSTGVDIELVEGENTVSTTLYNKPEMTIKYK